MVASKAAATVAAYRYSFRLFHKFTDLHGLNSLPATAMDVALFLEHQRLLGSAPSTLATLLCGISWMHTITGHSPPADSPICRAVIEGAKRLATPPPCRTIPATRPMLLSLYQAVHRTPSLSVSRIYVLCLFAYAGCLRFDEVVALKFADVIRHAEGLRLILRKSKTDQHKLGAGVELAASGGTLCPLAAYMHYRAQLPSRQTAPAALLFPSSKGGRPIARNTCVTHVRRILTADGSFPTAARITMHSFRIGCATALLELGTDSADIRAHGRWRSDRSLDRYLRPNREHQLNVSRRLGL